MEKENNISFLKESIEHYKRMITWVFTYKGKLKRIELPRLMRSSIDENWFGENCPFCTNQRKIIIKNHFCEGCYLLIQGYPCMGINSLWTKMSTSETLFGWLFYAIRLLFLFKKLLKKEEKGVSNES